MILWTMGGNGRTRASSCGKRVAALVQEEKPLLKFGVLVEVIFVIAIVLTSPGGFLKTTAWCVVMLHSVSFGAIW